MISINDFNGVCAVMPMINWFIFWSGCIFGYYNLYTISSIFAIACIVLQNLSFASHCVLGFHFITFCIILSSKKWDTKSYQISFYFHLTFFLDRLYLYFENICWIFYYNFSSSIHWKWNVPQKVQHYIIFVSSAIIFQFHP